MFRLNNEIKYILAVLILLSICISISSASEVLEVRSEDSIYIHIQDAIDAAAVGDTILVYGGDYTEDLVINKTIILKGIGQPMLNSSSSEEDAITIYADGVTVEGFTIQASLSGINILSSNNHIYNNSILDNHYGVYLDNATENIISSNTLTSNCYGIEIFNSAQNTIENNQFSFSDDYGLVLLFSKENQIYDNNIDSIRSAASSNQWYGSDEGNTYEKFDEPIEGCIDTDDNGIGDTPYAIPGCLDFDTYPRVKKESPSSKSQINVDDSGMSNELTTNEDTEAIASTGIPEVLEVGSKDSIHMHIQDAIDAASADDTVLVYSGNYTEDLMINTTIVLKGIGQPMLNSSSSEENAITIYADGVTVEGFTIQASLSGINILSSNNHIFNNSLVDNHYGIYLDNATENIINSNTLTSNCYGIEVFNSAQNTIEHNQISLSDDYGIVLLFSTENQILGNNIDSIRSAASSNKWYGSTGGNVYEIFDEPTEGCVDADGDGIGDAPYAIPGCSEVDTYPLVKEELPSSVLSEIYTENDEITHNFTTENLTVADNLTVSDNFTVISNLTVTANLTITDNLTIANNTESIEPSVKDEHNTS